MFKLIYRIIFLKSKKFINSTTLDLYRKNIGPESGEEILNLLEENFTLTDLQIGIYNKKIKLLIDRNKILIEMEEFVFV